MTITEEVQKPVDIVDIALSGNTAHVSYEDGIKPQPPSEVEMFVWYDDDRSAFEIRIRDPNDNPTSRSSLIGDMKIAIVEAYNHTIDVDVEYTHDELGVSVFEGSVSV